MRITVQNKPDWRKKFFWLPTYVRLDNNSGQWLWLESFLVHRTIYGDGSPIQYIKNLDGSEIK